MEDEMNRTQSSIFALAVGTAACLEPPRAIEALPPAAMTIEFEVNVDPIAGTIELTQLDRTTRGLSPVPVVQDGVPARGPADTVELVTTLIGFNQACGAANSFCADITLRSFYGEVLTNTFVQLTAITPFAAHGALN